LQLIWPWQDRKRQFSWLKASAFALVLLPAIRFVNEYGTGEYGSLSSAAGSMIYWSGVWATAVLLLALAVTPAIRIFRWGALVDVRRMIGVTGLVYTLVHLLIWFPLRSWNYPFMANEMMTRLTLIVATVSTIGLIALGVTSVDAAIRHMGARNWQRLHNLNYAITGLAVLHVVLARGTYPEQYLLTGIFVWLMAWRVLDRYGKGVDVRALAMLAVATCVFTGLLEAFCIWVRRGYDFAETLGYNFTLAILDLGVPPAWQILASGLLVALAAAIVRQAPRLRAARAAGLEPRKVG
jgi:sulfoxide reductase heme-binding subunit YedZ